MTPIKTLYLLNNSLVVDVDSLFDQYDEWDK